MVPTIGRLVHYCISQSDADSINKVRADAAFNRVNHRINADGSQIHIGNYAVKGQVFPMIIVAVHGRASTSFVNGQVFLDGNDSFWALSVAVGEGPGTFSWPTRG